MKPQFEHVAIPQGCSIRVFNRQIPEIPFEWHHHPEYELTLTLNSRGWRFIADHIGPYDSQDLVLVPSDMPHTWASTAAIDDARPHTAVVIWFTGSWVLQIAEVCPEYAVLRKLLKRATAALSFAPPAGATVESRMPGLLSGSARQRLQTALELLSQLADMDAAPLATSQKARPTVPSESLQLKRILDLLHEHFAEPIRLEDLCAVGNISPRSLHRLFMRHMGENVSDYLGRLRIGRACMSLVETDLPVSVVANESGFTNLSNFNRRFREARHMTPKEFRRFVVKQGCVPSAKTAVDLTKRSPSLENAKRDISPRASTK